MTEDWQPKEERGTSEPIGDEFQEPASQVLPQQPMGGENTLTEEPSGGKPSPQGGAARAALQLNSLLEGDNSFEEAAPQLSMLPLQKATTMEISWDNNKVVGADQGDDKAQDVGAWPALGSDSDGQGDNAAQMSQDEGAVKGEEMEDARDGSLDSNFDSMSSQSDHEGLDGRERGQSMAKPVRESRRKRRSKRKKGGGGGARDTLGDLNADKDGCLQKHNRFVIKNGCCRECMKAFSKQGKACLCQVPRGQRRTGLPPHGCKYCGCHGCNPIDIRKNKRQELREAFKRMANTDANRQKLSRIIDSDEEGFENSDKWLQTRSQLAGHVEQLVRTLAAKVTAQVVASNKYVPISQELLGFGVPTRHRTYILGCNRQWMAEDEYKLKRPKFSN